MPDSKTSLLTELTTPRNADILYALQTASGIDKKITLGTLSFVENVKLYGAIGDGVTDDTSAVQAAIDAAQAGGGSVFIPRGVYRVNALTVTDYSLIDGVLNTTRLFVFGEGHQSILRSNSTGNMITVGVTGGVRLFDIEFRDMTIDGNFRDASASNRAAHGLVFTNSTRCKVSGVRIFQCNGNGVRYLNGSYGPHVIDFCLIRENQSHGIEVVGTGGSNNGNALYVSKSGILSNGQSGAGDGIYIGDGDGINVHGCDIEANNGHGVNVAYNSTTSITGNYIESNTGYGVYYADAVERLHNDANFYFSNGLGRRRYPASGILKANIFYSVTLNMLLGTGGVQDAYAVIPEECELHHVYAVMNENLTGAVDETLDFAATALTSIGTLTIPGSSVRNTYVDNSIAVAGSNYFGGGARLRIRSSQSNAGSASCTVTCTFIKKR